MNLWTRGVIMVLATAASIIMALVLTSNYILSRSFNDIERRDMLQKPRSYPVRDR